MKEQEEGDVKEAGATETGPDKGQGRVTVTVDNKEVKTRRGQHRVSELKTLGGVNADYALSQLVDGVLTDLTDDDKVHIRGGEVFSSHPRTGGAS